MRWSIPPLFAVANFKQKVARFRQINLDEPTMHHDALEFPDGDIALLTELREGQRATVLQLPAPAPTAATRQTTSVLSIQIDGGRL